MERGATISGARDSNMPKKLDKSSPLNTVSIRLSRHARELLNKLGKVYGSQGVAVTVALELLTYKDEQKGERTNENKSKAN